MALTKSSFKKDPKTQPQPAEEKAESSNKELIITTSWDDGGVMDTQIAEVLKKYDLPGTFYIIVDAVNRETFLTWQQIKDIEAMGFEIGSHTVSHPSDLKLLHDEQLHYEIQNSKDMIEAVLGHSISKFCYPRGRFDDRVKDHVARAGYVEARGTGRTGVTTYQDKFSMPGTIHIFQREEYGLLTIFQYAKQVLDKAKVEGGYVNIWGHSKEIEENNLWEVLDQVLAYASQIKNEK